MSDESPSPEFDDVREELVLESILIKGYIEEILKIPMPGSSYSFKVKCISINNKPSILFGDYLSNLINDVYTYISNRRDKIIITPFFIPNYNPEIDHLPRMYDPFSRFAESENFMIIKVGVMLPILPGYTDTEKRTAVGFYNLIKKHLEDKVYDTYRYPTIATIDYDSQSIFLFILKN